MTDETLRLRRELYDLSAELRDMKKQNAALDIKFMNLYRALEKIQLSETHKQAVQMAISILKQTSIDHSVTKIVLPSLPLPEPIEPPSVSVPPSHPTPQRKRRKTTTKASLGGFMS